MSKLLDEHMKDMDAMKTVTVQYAKVLHDGEKAIEVPCKKCEQQAEQITTYKQKLKELEDWGCYIADETGWKCSLVTKNAEQAEQITELQSRLDAVDEAAWDKLKVENQRLKEFNEQLKDAVIKTSFLDGETFIADLEKEFEAAPPQKDESDE